MRVGLQLLSTFSSLIGHWEAMVTTVSGKGLLEDGLPRFQ